MVHSEISLVLVLGLNYLLYLGSALTGVRCSYVI